MGIENLSRQEQEAHINDYMTPGQQEASRRLGEASRRLEEAAQSTGVNLEDFKSGAIKLSLEDDPDRTGVGEHSLNGTIKGHSIAIKFDRNYGILSSTIDGLELEYDDAKKVLRKYDIVNRLITSRDEIATAAELGMPEVNRRALVAEKLKDIL